MNQIKQLLRNHFRVILFPVALVMAIAISGCQPATTQQAEAPSTHPITGVVVSVDKSKGLVTVKHDAVPGKMEAMTMPFSPADPAVLSTLHKGDRISADMSVQANGAVLDHIKVLPEKSK